jgi:hypothetical protein
VVGRKCDTLQTRYPPRDHGLRVGFPYHYLITPPLSKGFPLSTTWGRAEQLCEFEPWEPSPSIILCNTYSTVKTKETVRIRYDVRMWLIEGNL